jgi:kumamolisin
MALFTDPEVTHLPSDFPIPDTDRVAIPDARDVGPADPDELVRVTVYVRRRPSAPALESTAEDLGSQLPSERKYLSEAEFASTFGADPADLQRVGDFAMAHHLTVLESSVPKRSVLLEGRVADLNTAFGVDLRRYQHGQGGYRGRTGPVHVPSDLRNIVTGVFGLDNRQVGRSRMRQAAIPDVALDQAAAGGGLPPGTFFPPDLAKLYQFPDGTDATGQCIGILAFNDPQTHGGYSLSAIQTYFRQVLQLPVPSIQNVVVHGPGNDPGDDSQAGLDRGDSSGEIMLDLQVAGGAAPGAKLVMYFTEFTEQGWLDAIHTAIADAANNPSVLSISYGNPEDDVRSAWTRAAITHVNQTFQEAAQRGITVCVASGDDGSRDQAGDSRAHVDFPASSPLVLGCGGTFLQVANGAISSEVVWNEGPGSATGGGISRFFGLPSYQQHAGVPPSANPPHKPGRGVPDVAGVADPRSGVRIIRLSGQFLTITGGTSATAPLWSALIARLNQGLGTRVGYLNPLLYSRLTGDFRDITEGNNGAYQAAKGWDACTGWGSPNGAKLLQDLKSPT